MYHVEKTRLIQHLSVIKTSGRPVRTATELLNCPRGDSVVLTFDDGWKGAFEIALALLREFGLKATFYITRDFIGRRGFCDTRLIREATDSGMEIGVHGTTGAHVFVLF